MDDAIGMMTGRAKTRVVDVAESLCQQLAYVALVICSHLAHGAQNLNRGRRMKRSRGVAAASSCGESVVVLEGTSLAALVEHGGIHEEAVPTG